jgi:hypothetical protein
MRLIFLLSSRAPAFSSICGRRLFSAMRYGYISTVDDIWLSPPSFADGGFFTPWRFNNDLILVNQVVRLLFRELYSSFPYYFFIL